MQRNTGRRLLVPPVGWANMLAGACAQRDSARAELAEARRENAELRQELQQCQHLRDLLAARAAREQAEDSLREMYRERELERAFAATHDPATRLH